jgi:hypothetical protein
MKKNANKIEGLKNFQLGSETLTLILWYSAKAFVNAL